jgi:hypothetical protein
MRCPASALAIALVSLPATGHAQGYFFRQYTIYGLTNIAVTGVNDAGLAVGTYPYPAGMTHGFSGRLGHAANLPPFDNAVTFPTGINDTGTIVGIFDGGGNAAVLTYRAGVYSSPGFSTGGLSPAFPPYIGAADRIAFIEAQMDGSVQSVAGPIGSPAFFPILGSSPEVASINIGLHVAGQMLVTKQTHLGANTIAGVFFGTATHLRPVVPLGALAAYGGWVNDADQVAGSYLDHANKLHGYIYDQKSYTTFDMPTVPVSLSVQGIDSKGRVVGVYSDARSQHGFVYSAGHVTKLGAFSPADTVHVGTSYFGRFLAISDTAPNGTARSWLASCKGGGC